MNLLPKPTAPKLTLAETLDRVPLKDLRGAIERRVKSEQRVRLFTTELLKTVNETIDATVATHKTTRREALGNGREAFLVRTRWDIYAALHALGLTTLQIAAACGQDRTRVYHGLKKYGLEPHTD